MLLNLGFVVFYYFGTKDKRRVDVSAVKLMMYVSMFSVFFGATQSMI